LGKPVSSTIHQPPSLKSIAGMLAAISTLGYGLPRSSSQPALPLGFSSGS
jgi:hypothetical protein